MKADVLIAGGGIMGCATAIELARKGKSVTIFEKDVPGRHASGNNSGGVRCQGRGPRRKRRGRASRRASSRSDRNFTRSALTFGRSIDHVDVFALEPDHQVIDLVGRHHVGR